MGTLSLNEIHRIGLSPFFDIIGKGINSRTIDLLKTLSLRYSHQDVMDYSYYRTRNRAEIDLIIQGDFGFFTVEIKMGTHVKPGALRWMKDFLLKNDIPLGIVINNSDRVVKLDENIIQLPISVL